GERGSPGRDSRARAVAGFGRDREYDAVEHRPGQAPESFDRMRSVSGVGLDGNAGRGEMLLPADAPRYVEDQRAGNGDDALRRPGAGRGTAGGGGVGSHVDGSSVRERAGRIYDLWGEADPAERQRMSVASADRTACKARCLQDAWP
ncbi:relaxase, partial [Pseudomonas sp. MWU12-2534b]